MLNSDFKILLVCNKKLENSDTLLYECEICKPLLNKFFGNESCYFSYSGKDNFRNCTIKDGVQKLFNYLIREAQSDKEIYLIIYDEREITDTVNESYNIITVNDNSQCYDLIYRMEQSALLPLTIYRFVL